MTNTCSKTATEILEIIEDHSKENIFKKEPLVAFYEKSVVKYFAQFIGKHLCQSLFINKVD